MNNFNLKYSKFINDKTFIKAERAVRGKFYIIKEYITVDNIKETYSEINAPIIFTLFVSRKKDIIHAVKISEINPITIKKFFGKFVNENTEELEMAGNSKKIYNTIVSKVPKVTNEAYRTYKMSGIRKMIELDMDINELIPKSMRVIGIDPKSQKRNI